MITINAKVIGENIQLTDSPLVASKSVQSVRILFDFDDAWDGFGRIALFWGVDDEVYTSQIINGVTIVPHEAMADRGKIKFGVYGTNGSKRIVTVKMTYNVVEGAYTSVATESVEPSASLLDQIEAGIGTMEDYAKEIRQTSKAAVEIAQDANTRSVIALEKASTAESDSATMATDIDELKKGVRKYELESGSFFGGAFLDEDTNTLYFTDKSGHVIAEIENIGRGGGGGGGGGDSTSRISMTNTSGWQSKTLAQNTDGTIPSCPVTFVWSSLENDMPTGNGSLRITINGSSAAMLEVGQGQVTIDMAQYLKSGTSLVDFTVYDIYGKSRNIRFTVDVIEMYIESSFDSTQSYRGAFPFAYTPHGAVRKTVYFEMDGQSIGEVSTATNGHQQSFTVPQQTHGSHVLRVWFTADINGQTVSSNVLYYEIICIDPLINLPIIVSNFDRTTVQQYETLEIKYNVYDPLNMVTSVVIEVDGTQAAALNADRQTQVFTWRVSKAEPLTIAIKAGSGSNVSTKTIALQVTESDVHPEAVTDQLSLHLDAVGRSNSEANPDVWEYGQGTGKISAAFTGFNWARDGWQQDDSGLSCLRVLGGAQVTIPFKPYAQDFRGSGKAIELEFQSHNVLNYESPIISCMSGGRGFEVYADHAVFRSARAEITCRFATERPTRLTLVVQPQSEHRLTYLYIDGVYQSIAQYSTTDSFQQANPVGITIGDASCGVDIYNIRVYDRELTSEEVLGNYIADRQDAFDMLKLYKRNDIFENGSITISKLPKELPYVILTGPESPQYKGDKKTVSMVYEEPINDANSRHLTATGVVVNVQGTVDSNTHWGRASHPADAGYKCQSFVLYARPRFRLQLLFCRFTCPYAPLDAITAVAVVFNQKERITSTRYLHLVYIADGITANARPSGNYCRIRFTAVITVKLRLIISGTNLYPDVVNIFQLFGCEVLDGEEAAGRHVCKNFAQLVCEPKGAVCHGLDLAVPVGHFIVVAPPRGVLAAHSVVSPNPADLQQIVEHSQRRIVLVNIEILLIGHIVSPPCRNAARFSAVRPDDIVHDSSNPIRLG